MMIDEIYKTTENHMKKSIEMLQSAFQKVRTGRAHTGLLDHIMVSYYGNDVPLTQVASVAIGDSRTLTVTPWEKQLVPVIEKAIMTADLGLNPATAGQVIRIPLPPLTEERRKDLIKIIRNESENSRVSIRNIRRDANSQLKDLLKEKKISEDDEHFAVEKIQKITDKYIGEIDRLLTLKESELLEI